jgi:Glycosyl transferases group 1
MHGACRPAMKALILADELFATRERSMLARLEIGLADEGVRVVHAIPPEAAARDPGQVFSRALTYETSSIGPLRRVLARRLAAAVRDPDAEEDTQAVSIVHVFGGSAWDFGADLARELDAGLVLEVWRSPLVTRAAALAQQAADHQPPIFAAPDPLIERRLRESTGGATIRLTPWGVHVPDTSHALLSQKHAPSAVIIAGGNDRAALSAALAGLAQVVASHKSLMVFVDSRVVEKASLWPIAQKLGLLPSLSLIEDIEDRRDLLVHADLLILPEARGEHHSVLLDAMAAPMAVVAAEDHAVGTLLDGRTALLVKRPDPAEWAGAIGSLLDSPARANSLAASARDYIRTERTVFRHVRSVLDMYQWIDARDAFPIRAPAT